MIDNVFNGLFGKLGKGMCRLSMNGEIAVKTSDGYKTFNHKTGRLVNCQNFVFPIGEEFFFCIPTNKVRKGDIILVKVKGLPQPKCVIEASKDKITAINYEDNTVETLLPERHIFMGNTYFYSKIVSMFGDTSKIVDKGNGKIFKYMMMSEMLKGDGSGSSNPMSAMLPMMLLGGGDTNIFGDMLNFDFDTDFDEDEEEATEEDKPKKKRLVEKKGE